MQATRDFVPAAAELTAGMQNGQDRFDRTLSGLGVNVRRDTTTVVPHPNAAVRQQCNAHFSGVAGEGFVDTIVDDFPHQVVQAFDTGSADVHTWPLTYRLKPLKYLNLIC